MGVKESYLKSITFLKSDQKSNIRIIFLRQISYYRKIIMKQNISV